MATKHYLSYLQDTMQSFRRIQAQVHGKDESPCASA